MPAISGYGDGRGNLPENAHTRQSPARVQNKSENRPPRYRKCVCDTPYARNDAFMSRLRGPIVASIHTFRSARVYLQPENRSAALRDVAAKVIYFAAVATVFAFVLILTTGLHP
jgi:hypothetical protein